jgi:GNAT superfamily N-acetyltransferase
MIMAMSSLEFVTMVDRRWAGDVLRMMGELYETDQPGLNVNPEKFPLTIDRLLAEPSRGRIVLPMQDAAPCGYALLIPFWSNEWGGTVLLLDELFVLEEFRGRGIGKAFLALLERERPFDAIVLALEVSPRNTRARALYESMGFADRHLSMLTRRLPG